MLGDYGVNTANHTVWAVVNHNSEFAVVPEPGALLFSLLVASGCWQWRGGDEERARIVVRNVVCGRRE